MKIPLLQNTDLTSRKQRVHLLILSSLGMLVVLGVLLILPSLSPQVPRWYRDPLRGGQGQPEARAPAQAGLASVSENSPWGQGE